MLAALKAVEASPAASVLGYEVIINSDEEVGSLGSAALIAEAASTEVRSGLVNSPMRRGSSVAASVRPHLPHLPIVVRKGLSARIVPLMTPLEFGE
jgi:glutamate carboxypeptidase